MKPVEFWCDPGGASLPLPHNWEHTIGSDHATMALRADYREQLKRCHDELGIGHVRFHGLLSDDMGTMARERGKLVPSFHNVHAIWDFLLSIGMRPFVELSFMPTSLASGKTTVFDYHANVTPPRRDSAWGSFIRNLAISAIDRYGKAEVQKWPFEVWNEPNLRSFWRGSRDRYFRFYSTTARALKEVNADITVGGPASAQNAWIEEFLDYCERHRLPADFVSTHHYPTDEFAGSRLSTTEKLARARRGVLREEALDAKRRCRGKPLYYTEWNSSADLRDPLHDESYSAAFIVKTLLDGHGIADVYCFWSFSDLFEESRFPSLPFHGGFGLLTLHGIAKPSYRAFELLHSLGTELITPMDGRHPTVDAWVIHGPLDDQISVLITNHTYPKHEIVTERVLVHLGTRLTPIEASLARIDADHTNPKREWLNMGAVRYPSRRQIEALHDASVLHWRPHRISADETGVHVEVDVPPQGVGIVTLTFAGSLTAGHS